MTEKEDIRKLQNTLDQETPSGTNKDLITADNILDMAVTQAIFGTGSSPKEGIKLIYYVSCC